MRCKSYLEWILLSLSGVEHTEVYDIEFLPADTVYATVSSGALPESTEPRGEVDEELYAHLCEKFGITPAETLVVGDGMTDMLMAENAGCDGAAALFGYGDPAKLTEHSNYQINDLKEVLDIVKGTIMEKIALHGDIDLYNVNELKEQLQNCQAENILIDASDLQYIDSTGLGVLVSSRNKLKEKNGTIKIVGLKPHIYKIFALTSLDKIFEIEVAE